MKTVVIIFFAVMVLTVVEADWCPNPEPKVCVRRQNKCCRDAECGVGNLCCNESCGNICRQPVDYPTSGRKGEIC
ncbi:U15-lycotoxin-Ls1a like protein [Argiope bruennichi]|uniref:U15-lycotoxin-Ls1a like protein n=1 Tax=Argiope bruennichi TaxID=94029 RepID=A0A8T0EBX1_ARGBR|nr:U15-lycotoxin-Ls1a like protein [Argiope bruennichi]